MSTIDKRPFECYSWLRHAAKCQIVQTGWKFAVDSATIPLESLADAWEGVQKYMRDENFRNAEGATYMLERATLESALQNVPAQMLGTRNVRGECTAFTMGIMERNRSPFRNIQIYPADIRDTAVQILALLASGISNRYEVYRCVPDNLSEKQSVVINNLFAHLEQVFNDAGFAVSLHAVTAEQIRTDIKDFGAELPVRHIVKLDRNSSSSSCSPTDGNLDMMWINVSFNKVLNCIRCNRDYCFYCASASDGIEAIYSIPAQELYSYLNKYADVMNNEKWSFYLDFKNGAICSDISGHRAYPLSVVLKSSL